MFAKFRLWLWHKGQLTIFALVCMLMTVTEFMQKHTSRITGQKSN